MADTEDAVPKSEVAEAIRDAFTPQSQLMGLNVADALYEVSKSLDRIAKAIEDQAPTWQARGGR